MFSQRKVNEIDSFINNQQLNKVVSPRNAPFTNLSNLRKPMINVSPSRDPRRPVKAAITLNRFKSRQDLQLNRDFFCSNENHYNKKAEYIIHIQDEDMYYCGVCATQAASQGFTVNKIGGNNKRQKVLPHYPNLASNKRYHQVQNLLKEIMKLEGQFRRMDPRYTQQENNSQEQLLNNFYDELIIVVETMRKDHLADWKADRQRVDIVYDHMKNNMDDLNLTWEDVEDNLEKIVEGVDAKTYDSCIKTYYNRIQMFYQNNQNYREALAQLTPYHEEDLTRKIKCFEQKLIELWQDEPAEVPTKKRIHQVSTKAKTIQIDRQIDLDSRHEDQYIDKMADLPGFGHRQRPNCHPNTIKNVHEMLPTGEAQKNCEGQSAFRSLFDDDKHDGKMPENSPIFKQI